MKLTEAETERARQMFAAGMNWKAIGQRLGCCGTTAHSAVDAAFASQRQERRDVRKHPPKITPQAQDHIAEREALKADRLARLAEIPPDTRGLTARVFGDPIYERSALYRARGALNHG